MEKSYRFNDIRPQRDRLARDLVVEENANRLPEGAWS